MDVLFVCGQTLDDVAQRYVHRLVQDFERNGLQLPEEKQKEVQAWKQKLSKLGIQFQQHLSEETIEVSFLRDELKGLRDDFFGALEKDQDDKYKVSNAIRWSYVCNVVGFDTFLYIAFLQIALSYPTVFPILNTCTVESTRKAVEYAFNRRCMSTNVAILEEMLEIRHKVAQALGYENHAAYVLEQM